MERKTKHRILGFFVVVGLAIIVLPFFQGGKDPIAEARLTKTPPFPDQSVQVNTNASTDGSSINQSSSIPIRQSSDETTVNQQPDDTISVVRPSVVNTATPDTMHPTEAVATPIENTTTESPIPTNVPVAEKAPKAQEAQSQPASEVPAATANEQASNVTELAPAVSAEDEDMQPQKTSLTTAKPAEKATIAKSEMVRDVADGEESVTKSATPIHSSVKAKKVTHIAKTVRINKVRLTSLTNSQLSNNGLLSLKNPAWVIQVGSYKNKANALRVVNQLRANGYRAFIQQINTALGDSTRVFVGPMPKQQSARQMASQLESDMHVRGMVISYKPLTL